MVRARLLGSSDLRVLLAGVAAFIALVAYVAVAYANTHATAATTEALKRAIAPWTSAYGSHLVAVPLTGGKYAVRVTPTSVGSSGALVPTFVYQPPPGRRFVVSLWLRGSTPGRIGVVVDELGTGGASALHAVDTTVPATTSWHKFTFRGRVEGRRLSIDVYVYRSIARRVDISKTWFEIRGLTGGFSGS